MKSPGYLQSKFDSENLDFLAPGKAVQRRKDYDRVTVTTDILTELVIKYINRSTDFRDLG